ncbi:peptide-methionine (R)-S-oxide reductase [Candidatus Woesearchaeota archaeon]|nr:peptide-methionine (R)-S-oxide reductase [Candidatus Woesearchaeota archaeon]
MAAAPVEKYYCKRCRAPLFSASAVILKSSYWLSFSESLQGSPVEKKSYRESGNIKIEVICASCKQHLGDVYDDGSSPTKERYCVLPKSVIKKL